MALNNLLYKRLESLFGHVKISNENEEMIVEYEKTPDGRKRSVIIYGGEHYEVCCPRCTDTRFRLRIQYTWGRRDPVTGQLNLHAIYCQNENCYADRSAAMELFDDLNDVAGAVGSLHNARLREGTRQPGGRIPPAGSIAPLTDLPDNHPANRYLISRFYDPVELTEQYKVGYCVDSDFYLARGRIYAPIYQGDELKGWQARYVGELNWKDPDSPPKWWTCPGTQKSRLLYNIDQAARYQTGVIVEGLGDVWNFGPMAVATLGASMSHMQIRMFQAAFRKGSGILLYDADILNSTDPRKQRTVKKIVSEMKGLAGGFAPVTLPDGFDPGSLEREYMREYVAEQAKAQGVDVNWGLK